MHPDAKFEPEVLTYSKPLKFISHQGWDVVKIFGSQYPDKQQCWGPYEARWCSVVANRQRRHCSNRFGSWSNFVLDGESLPVWETEKQISSFLRIVKLVLTIVYFCGHIYELLAFKFTCKPQLHLWQLWCLWFFYKRRFYSILNLRGSVTY